MPDIYPYGRDAPEGTYFAERRGGFDRGPGGPGEEWDPGAANNSATASAAAELARMWATAPYGVEPDSTNYPGLFSSLHYATIVNNFLVASADTQVLFNDGGTILGNADFTYNKTTGVMRLFGGIQQDSDSATWLAYRRTAAGSPIGGVYGTSTGIAVHTYDPVAPSVPLATFGGTSSGLAYILFADELAINRAGGNTVATWNQDGKLTLTPYTANGIALEITEGKLQLYAPTSTHQAPINIPQGTVPATPLDGDLWATSTGIYARINGNTIQLGGTAFNVDDLSDVVITGVQDGDLLGWDAGTSKWVNVGALPPPVWGVISGTLSDQTDLQAALDTKSATSHTHDGIKWTYSGSAPVSATPGDRWFNSTTGKEYTYVNDGDSSQWVELYAGGGGSGNGLTNPVTIEQGGTGQITAQAARNALLPSQTSNANKALVTDGTNVSWVDVATTGSFTPTLAGSSGGTFGSVTGTCTWTKIGNRVFFSGSVSWGSVSGFSGGLRIGGFPNNSSEYCAVSIWTQGCAVDASGAWPQGYMTPSADYITVAKGEYAGGVSGLNSVTATGQVQFSGSYKVA